MYAITCFSYKGGAGRSTSSANLAAELARRGKKVAIVDADLGAPGLHYMFRVESLTERSSYVGTHHLVNDMIEPKELLDNHLIDVGKHHSRDIAWRLGEGKLYLLASSPKHQPVLSANDEAGELATVCMRALRRTLQERSFDYLIMDSASGTQQLIAGACMAVSDLVLVFFRWTLQHVYGTSECVSELLASGTCANWSLATVATSVPDANEIEDIVLQTRLKDAKDEYRRMLKDANPAAVPVVEIPEYFPFKWVESIAVFDTDLFVELANYVTKRAEGKLAGSCE